MSLLRKQESRLVPAQAGIQAYFCSGGNPSNMHFSYLLDSRFRGNDTLQPLLPQSASPARGEAVCFIRLNSYPFTIISPHPNPIDGRTRGGLSATTTVVLRSSKMFPIRF